MFWCLHAGLLHTLLVHELVKTFPAFCGTRRFMIMFKTPCHLPMFWARLIQSNSSNPFFYKLQFNILPSAAMSSKWAVSFNFSHTNRVCVSLVPIRAACPAYLIFLDLVTTVTFVVEQHKSRSSSVWHCPSADPNVFLSTCSRTRCILSF